MAKLRPDARLYLLHAGLLTLGLAIGGLLFNLAIVALGYAELRVALPLLGERSFLGLINSLPALLAALTSLPIWWLVSRSGPLPALLLGSALQAVFLLIIAFADSWQILLLAALITGPAAVLYQVSAAPLIMQQSSTADRDLLFSLNAGINIGVAGLGSLLGGLLPGLAAALLGTAPQSPQAYRVVFGVAGLTALVSLLPLLVLYRSRSEGRKTKDESGVEDPLKLGTTQRESSVIHALPLTAHRPPSLVRRLPSLIPLLPFALPPLIISCGAALFIPYLNLYFQQRYGVPDAWLGAIFAAIGVTTGLATLGAPIISRRFGRMPSVVLTQALAVPCLLLLGFTPLLGLAVGSAVLRGALMNMASPLYDAEAMERAPADLRPTLIGLINGAFSVGYTFAPAISAEIQLRAGFTPIFVITAICYASAAALTYALFVKKSALAHTHLSESAEL